MLASADGRGDGIAIVGIACRLPMAPDPAAFWALLRDGLHAIIEAPADRWGTGAPRHGGFLDDVRGFDAAFFGISPREAADMDPQQRLALELAWEALEDAGIVPGRLHGGRTGVFMGAMWDDYAALSHAGDGEAVTAHTMTGLHRGVIANRVSYTLGLRGPSMVVDTGQSSSLVAVHTACAALRRGDAELALAGGVNLNLTERGTVMAERFGGLSPDGRCFSFDARANGYVRGEGGGLVVLKPLSRAVADGDRVYAVIRGGAVNNDGPAEGLTAPSPDGQREVLRRAYADAGVDPGRVRYVELHGTGTRRGDPVEAAALGTVLGAGRAPSAPLLVGSAKTNVGHLEGAAGIVGLIKVALSLRHRRLPASLNFAVPNPEIPLDDLRLRVVDEPRAWPSDGEPLVAGVSAFGMGGTNCHLVLTESPVPGFATGGNAGSGPGSGGEAVSAYLPWLLSGRSEQALRDQARRLAEHFSVGPAPDPADVAFSLAATRTRFSHRACVLGADHAEYLQGLAALAEGRPAPNLVRGTAGSVPKTVFVFPGQGSQWDGMATELLEESPVFRDSIQACARALAPYTDWSLTDALNGKGLDRVDVVQPALFAVMVSLARLWQHHGVQPDAVIGHSQGEIAAAHLAGALSLDDAARIVALRSKALTRLAGTGAMASIPLPAEQVQERLTGTQAHIAAINGPNGTVISGDPADIAQIVNACQDDGVRARTIPVDYASHGPHVEPIREEILDLLAEITPRKAPVPLYSTLTGGLLDTTQMTADYWYDNLRNPVRFGPVAGMLMERGHDLFIEVSAHPVLVRGVRETAEGADVAATVLGTLRRGQGGARRFGTSLAQAQVSGIEPETPGGARIELPTYPFERRPYWLRPGRGTADLATAGLEPAGHPLLGAAAGLAESGGTVFTGRVSVRAHPWLGDHTVWGTVVLPRAALVELALHAGHRTGHERVEEFTLEGPPPAPGQGEIEVQVTVGPADVAGRRPVAVHTRPDGGPEWTRHASGRLAPATPNDAAARPAATAPAQAVTPEPWPPPGAAPVDLDDLYMRLGDAGHRHGAAFQGLRAAWRDGDEVWAEIEAPDGVPLDATGYGVHPALLDAAFQAAQALAVPDGQGGPPLPCSWTGVMVHAAEATRLRVHLAPAGPGAVSLDITDPTGVPVATVESLTLRPDEPGPPAAGGGAVHPDSLFRLGWTPVPAPLEQVPVAGRCAVLGDGTGLSTDARRYRDLAALREDITSGAPVPEIVIATCASGDGDDTGHGLGFAAGGGGLAARTLELLQEWLADDRLTAPGPDGTGTASRLVVLTRSAVAARNGEDVGDLPAAAAWGLIRTAQCESPGRFTVIDHDEGSGAWLAAALATGESQLAVREGILYAPRLARWTDHDAPAAPGAKVDAAPTGLDPGGTVLVTGGTGPLAALLACHLVTGHGARHLLLAGPRSRDAAGSLELEAELTAHGARVTVADCDVADRAALAALLAAIPAERPLTAIVHTTPMLQGGPLESLEPRHLNAAVGAAAEAAANLHDLTADKDLAAFVLCSSVTGVLGGPGQADHAAAGAFLDALAQHRRACGLTATSLAWGPWARDGGGSGAIEVALEGGHPGVVPLLAEEALALYDAAYEDGAALALPVRLNTAALRHHAARSESMSPVLRGLVPRSARRIVRTGADRAPSSGTWVQRVAAMPERERREAILDLVRTEAARVLGHADPRAVELDRTFKESGLDSHTAVELRDHLGGVTGLPLPATLTFDHPTPVALAAYLRAELAMPGEAGPSITEELIRLEDALLAAPRDGETVAEAVTRLRNLLQKLDGTGPGTGGPGGPAPGGADLRSASAETIFDFIDNELGAA